MDNSPKEMAKAEIIKALDKYAKELNLLKGRFLGEVTGILEREDVSDLPNIDLADLDDDITLYLTNEDMRDICLLYDEWYYSYLAVYYRQR